VSLPADEQGERDRRGRERAEDVSRNPAVRRALNDPVGEGANTAIASSAPSTSRRGADSLREAGIVKVLRIKSRTAIGTFSQKTACHPSGPINAPAASGPTVTATPELADQIVKALVRSLGRNSTRTNASVAGMISAPETPISARAAITSVGVVDNAANTDAAPNPTRPRLSARRRPKRSPAAPNRSNRLATVSGYASRIHRVCEVIAWSFCWMSVTATVSEVFAATTITSAIDRTNSAGHRREYARSLLMLGRSENIVGLSYAGGGCGSRGACRSQRRGTDGNAASSEM
jgi:hypothetical protein